MTSGEKVAVWKRPEVFRLLLVALFAEIGYAVLNISSMPVYLHNDRHFSASLIGLVLTSFLLSEAVFKSIMGGLSDKIGRKKLIIFGPSLTIFTALATLIVPKNIGSFEPFLIALLRVFDGIGAAMIWPAAFALMSDTVEVSKRQQAMSLLNMCYLVGIALALPFGGILNDLTGEREASFFLAAGLFCLVALIGIKFLPSEQSLKKHTKPKATLENQAVFFTELLKSASKIPQFLGLAFLTFMGIGFPMAIIKLFAEHQFGASETTFGLIALPSAIGMAALSMPMSHFGQKIGISKAVHYGLALCAIGVGIIGLGGIIPGLRNLVVLGAGALPVGLGFLLAIPAWYTSVSAINKNSRASNIGAVMTAQGLGTIVGAPLGAFCYDYFKFVNDDFGRYSPFMGCAVCLILSWTISMRVLHTTDSKED